MADLKKIIVDLVMAEKVRRLKLNELGLTRRVELFLMKHGIGGERKHTYKEIADMKEINVHRVRKLISEVECSLMFNDDDDSAALLKELGLSKLLRRII